MKRLRRRGRNRGWKSGISGEMDVLAGSESPTLPPGNLVLEIYAHSETQIACGCHEKTR